MDKIDTKMVQFALFFLQCVRMSEVERKAPLTDQQAEVLARKLVSAAHLMF